MPDVSTVVVCALPVVTGIAGLIGKWLVRRFRSFPPITVWVATRSVRLHLELGEADPKGQ